jgi:uncharacterized protein YhaN
MRQWLSDFTTLSEKAGEAARCQAEAGLLAGEVEACRGALESSLGALGETPAARESLAALVVRARLLIDTQEGIARQGEEIAREMERLSGELEAAAARLAVLEEDHRRWREHWGQALQPLGLGAGTRPAEANAVMEELKSFFDKLREAEVLQRRMDGIERDAGDFRARVAALAGAVAPDLAGRPAAEAAGELQRRLTAGREAHSRRQALQAQLDQEKTRRRKAEEAVAEESSLLQAMCGEAGVAGSDALPEAERRSSRRRQLEAERAREEERLLQLGGGATVEEFIQEAAEVDPDGMAGEMGRLEEELGRLTAQRSELDQRIGGERTELGRMDGGDRAAGVAEEIQAVLGGLERDVGHYARLRIAGKLLAMAMERFREKSQGPILARAAGLFKRITCGSFDGLRADRDPDGNPVLVGVRARGGELVALEGMSDGSADQLYLALRLAGIEHYLERGEALPLILDDILVKFDDDRAAAALQALAELAEKTQVIFFTHHRHLLELARQRIAPECLAVHRLGA